MTRGMIGEAVVLCNLATFMPRIQEASAGRYSAFLFVAYAVVLGIAEPHFAVHLKLDR